MSGREPDGPGATAGRSPQGQVGQVVCPGARKAPVLDIGSSILSLPTHVPVAQLDSAAASEAAGHPFESDRGCHGAHLAGVGGGLQTRRRWVRFPGASPRLVVQGIRAAVS